jgi:hypothetical protein
MSTVNVRLITFREHPCDRRAGLRPVRDLTNVSPTIATRRRLRRGENLKIINLTMTEN